MEFDSDIRVRRAVSLHATEKGRSIKRPFLVVVFPYEVHGRHFQGEFIFNFNVCTNFSLTGYVLDSGNH